jgi:hypothetical protein
VADVHGDGQAAALDGAGAGAQGGVDPDADGRGRHNAEGRPDELRVPVDGPAGNGKHEADGYVGRPSGGG